MKNREVREALAAAYRDKYRNYRVSIVDPVLTEQARATIKLVPLTAAG